MKRKKLKMKIDTTLKLQRRTLGRWSLAAAMLLSIGLAGVTSVQAADEAPDALVRRLFTDVLGTIRTDSSIKAKDVSTIMALVDAKIMPNVNFQRMTSSAVGPAWRQATPEQKKRLQDEFKLLLIRTYAGALDQVANHTVTVQPFRGSATDKEVLVRSVVRGGGGDPIQLDYRLEKTPGEVGGWRIFNLNVMGIWLVDTYRTQFTQEINNKGIDGLIASLAARTHRTP